MKHVICSRICREGFTPEHKLLDHWNELIPNKVRTINIISNRSHNKISNEVKSLKDIENTNEIKIIDTIEFSKFTLS